MGVDRKGQASRAQLLGNSTKRSRFHGVCFGYFGSYCTLETLSPKPFNPDMWEFPKVGDPNIVPQIVGSLL